MSGTNLFLQENQGGIEEEECAVSDIPFLKLEWGVGVSGSRLNLCS